MPLYNEIEPYAIQWLRNLIGSGHLPEGKVDERSIQDLRPDELEDESHFFAGIGGWPLALQLAGWEGPVWTGSCPCQPFSAAGKRGGFDDERHLWPAWFHLIGERMPPVIFGEQVASRDGLAWLDLVQADLEGLGYTVGAVVAPAAGFGAPHIRSRLYFVAHSEDANWGRCREQNNPHSQVGKSGASGLVADAERWPAKRYRYQVAGTQGENQGRKEEREWIWDDPRNGEPTNGFWSDAEWLYCKDGKYRPIKPGLFPLAHRVPARVGRLRAYGNAIVIPQAVKFIRAFMDIAAS
jgi:DNA (cytosine-5)-methyltransferase 1